MQLRLQGFYRGLSITDLRGQKVTVIIYQNLYGLKKKPAYDFSFFLNYLHSVSSLYKHRLQSMGSHSCIINP